MSPDFSSSAPHAVQTLQAQIDGLGALCSQVQSLRQIPALLLHAGKPDGSEFDRLQEIGDSVYSTPIQDALHRAKQSLKADTTEINLISRRLNRKQRQVI